jgi:hypothetical protein
VASASTSTVPKVVFLITFKVNLLSGWIGVFANAILPAQADVSGLPRRDTLRRY